MFDHLDDRILQPSLSRFRRFDLSMNYIKFKSTILYNLSSHLKVVALRVISQVHWFYLIHSTARQFATPSEPVDFSLSLMSFRLRPHDKAPQKYLPLLSRALIPTITFFTTIALFSLPPQLLKFLLYLKFPTSVAFPTSLCIDLLFSTMKIFVNYGFLSLLFLLASPTPQPDPPRIHDPYSTDTTEWLIRVPDSPSFHHEGDLIGSYGLGHLVTGADLAEHELILRETCKNKVFDKLLDSTAFWAKPEHGWYQEEQKLAHSSLLLLQEKCESHLRHFQATKEAWVEPFSRGIRTPVPSLDGAMFHSHFPVALGEILLNNSIIHAPHAPYAHPVWEKENFNTTVAYRAKRIAPIAAIGAVVSFASMIYDSVSNLLTGRSISKLTVEVNRQGAQLSQVTKSVRTLQDSMKDIYSRLDYYGKWVRASAEVMLLQSSLDLVLEDSNRLVEGFQQLSFHRLSPRLVNATDMAQSLSLLRRRMNEAGYELIPQDLDDVFSCETSHLIFPNNTLLIFIHLPAIRSAAVMDLYSFIPMPLQLDPGTEGSMLLPAPEHRYIAVTKDGTMTRVYTESAFGHCVKIASFFRCPESYTYDKRLTSNCLSALFRSDHVLIGKLCKWDINPAQDHLAQVGKNEFLLYHHNEGEITKRCLSDPPTFHAVRFQGTRRVKAPPACSFATSSFLFDGQLDLTSTTTHITTKPLNLTALWVNINGDDFTSVSLPEMAAQVLSLGSQEDLTLHDVDALVDASFITRYFRYTTGIICALSLIALLSFFLYYFRYHLRRRVLESWRAYWRGHQDPLQADVVHHLVPNPAYA